MTFAQWLRLRLVELGAALFTAGILIGGLAAGVPFLLERIPEVIYYSFCCVAAVLLHAAIDGVARAGVVLVDAARRTQLPRIGAAGLRRDAVA